MRFDPFGLTIKADKKKEKKNFVSLLEVNSFTERSTVN